MKENFTLWVLFISFILFVLLLDLGVFHRKAHVPKFKEALLWYLTWVFISFLVNTFVFFSWGYQKALEFLTGYLVELSLSADNIFIFLVIFNYFAVPNEYRFRVLFWGILGAIIMRLLFILAGATLIKKFHFVIYIFGLIVIYSGIKLLFRKKEEIHPEKNPLLKLARKFLPVTTDYHGQKFFVRTSKKFMATPLFVVLLVIESTDVVFAIDSVPAIFAITRDPFIVFTSNICAILGLRSLYFLIENVMRLFTYLDKGLSVILVFIGLKMLISNFYKIPTAFALLFVIVVLAITILISVIKGNNKNQQKRK
ncbi:MAG: TerC family protein [Candidatus Hydrothermales bacterium]